MISNIIILLIMFFMYKELDDLRNDTEELIEKYNLLARETGNEHLAFNYITDEFKEEILKLLREGKESDAVYLVRTKAKISLEESKELIENLKNH